MAEELTLSIDQGTGEYTRLTRFFPEPIPRHLVARVTPIRKRFSLSAGSCMTKRSTCGWSQAITGADPPERFMVPLRLTWVASFSRCRSLTGRVSD
jgi:hypothetical protein